MFVCSMACCSTGQAALAAPAKGKGKSRTAKARMSRTCHLAKALELKQCSKDEPELHAASWARQPWQPLQRARASPEQLKARVLPVLLSSCGGGRLQDNNHSAAVQQQTLDVQSSIVHALYMRLAHTLMDAARKRRSCSCSDSCAGKDCLQANLCTCRSKIAYKLVLPCM